MDLYISPLNGVNIEKIKINVHVYLFNQIAIIHAIPLLNIKSIFTIIIQYLY